jgi:putative endopeptidase
MSTLRKTPSRTPRFLIPALLAAQGLLHWQAAQTAPAPAPATTPAADAQSFASSDGLYLEWIDRSLKPEQDFFRYANGSWLKANPIPPDRADWGVDRVLEQANNEFIRQLIEGFGRQDTLAPGSNPRKVADFYASGMDEAAIEAAGSAPLQPEFARIAAIAGVDELRVEFAHLQTLGITAPFEIGEMQDFTDSTRVIAFSGQSGLGLPNRDYYLKREPNFVAARKAYTEHVARIFALLGDAPSAAAQEAGAVMALETRLAKASMSDVEQRDPRAIYHFMSLRRAEALTPRLHWHEILERLGRPDIDSLNLAMPNFFKAVDVELRRTSLADWKTYLRWHLAQASAPFLSRAFVDEDFRMAAVLTGAQQLQPRWLRVLRAEDEALGFAIGEYYVAQKFPPAAKQAALAMVERIRDALKADLQTLAWMTPGSRAAAIKKLELMELRVGYPDRWRDYSALDIDRGPYVLNVLRAKEFDRKRELTKIGKPVDRSEWDMTPQTVNAYYDPSMNSLNLPAGILQPPYYDARWPDAANYGATGATIGHEMTHGFDDEGAKFDGQGNLRNWWAPADLVKFQAATRCVSEQYSGYTVDGGLHVQGDLVTGEAVADLGGLILALRAFHAVPAASAVTEAVAESGGFSADQQFFIAYAHSWAGAMRPQQEQEMVTTDPHPPPVYRVNGIVANLAEFQTAFGIASSSPMVRAQRCIIW